MAKNKGAKAIQAKKAQATLGKEAVRRSPEVAARRPSENATPQMLPLRKGHRIDGIPAITLVPIFKGKRLADDWEPLANVPGNGPERSMGICGGGGIAFPRLWV
jgi:hypothetical protein